MVTDLQLDVLLSGLTHLTIRHSKRQHRPEQAAMLPRLTALQSLTLDDDGVPGREAAGEDAMAEPNPTRLNPGIVSGFRPRGAAAHVIEYQTTEYGYYDCSGVPLVQ
jgi:hypothetical protein